MLIKSLLENRSLLLVMIQREVIGRYKGSFLGILWSFLNPVFMLLVYTFVFSVVFKARWQNGGDSKTEFALILFAGLMVYNLFSEVLNRSSGLIVENTNYVKKVIFPLEILPLVILGAAFIHLLFSLTAWLLFYGVIFGSPPITAWLFPLAIFPMLLFTLGLAWTLASLGVFVRDVGQLIVIITTAMLFLSPIFFPISALPEKMQMIMMLNPMTGIIESVRGVLIFGSLPDLRVYGISVLISSLVAWGGFAWFQKTRKGFADVL